MAVKDFPSITPDNEEWKLSYNSQTFTADLNGATQTREMEGARWSVTMTFSNRQGKDARALNGFLAGMRGRAGRVWVRPSDSAPLGNQTTSLAVGPAPTLSLDFVNEQYYISESGDEYTGSSFTVHGGTINDTECLVAGDFVEINGELKSLTADLETDELGQGTLEFAPPMRVSVSRDTAVTVNNPRCVMMPVDDGQAGWSINAPIIYNLNIELREPLDI